MNFCGGFGKTFKRKVSCDSAKLLTIISDCYISTSGGLQTYQGSHGDRPNITIIYLLYHILPNKRRCVAEIF